METTMDDSDRGDWRGACSGLAETSAQSGARVIVYWRPGCPYCLRLRAHLGLRRLHPQLVNIWTDPAAAAFVRSVAGGDETTPTVVIDGVAYVNPAPRLVVKALRARRASES
jgi:mycoredoxin